MTQGFVVYSMKENEEEYNAHTADVLYLLANTTEAYAALWRFMLELDLTSKVTAHLRSADEPVRWLVDDFRAVKVQTYDHLWLRILDVVECLQARPYFAPASLVLEVTDTLGHAAGTYSFEVVDGDARVSRVEAAADLTLSVNELSAIYLGGVSPTTLHRAERIVEHVPGSVAALEAAFHSPVTPWLSVWF
jgi:predicted acetyltransferase